MKGSSTGTPRGTEASIGQTGEEQKADLLERFDAPNQNEQVATFETDELTAVCPFDFGGPDYYGLTIRYVADHYALESRSLKRYLESWRNEEISAEHLGDRIYEDIQYIASPAKLYVRLEQARRGGIEETVEVGDRELCK